MPTVPVGEPDLTSSADGSPWRGIGLDGAPITLFHCRSCGADFGVVMPDGTPIESHHRCTDVRTGFATDGKPIEMRIIPYHCTRCGLVVKATSAAEANALHDYLTGIRHRGAV